MAPFVAMCVDAYYIRKKRVRPKGRAGSRLLFFNAVYFFYRDKKCASRVCFFSIQTGGIAVWFMEGGVVIQFFGDDMAK